MQTESEEEQQRQQKIMANNMTTLEQDLKKQILGRSKAEKVFRPWWDTLEDYLLNSLVLLGKYFQHLCQIGTANPSSKITFIPCHLS